VRNTGCLDNQTAPQGASVAHIDDGVVHQKANATVADTFGVGQALCVERVVFFHGAYTLEMIKNPTCRVGLTVRSF